MNINDLKLYLKIRKKQRNERKKVMNFVKCIKKAEKYKEKMRKNNSLILPTS